MSDAKLQDMVLAPRLRPSGIFSKPDSSVSALTCRSQSLRSAAKRARLAGCIVQWGPSGDTCTPSASSSVPSDAVCSHRGFRALKKAGFLLLTWFKHGIGSNLCQVGHYSTGIMHSTMQCIELIMARRSQACIECLVCALRSQEPE